MKPRIGILILALVLEGLVSVHPLIAQTAAPAPKLTLEDIHHSRKFTGKFFRGGRWAEKGPVITFIDTGDEAGTTDLISYDLETEKRSVLIDGTKLNAPDVGRPIRIEGYQYSDDGNTVLLYTDSERVWRRNTKGYYYLFDLKSEQVTPLSDRAKGFQMFAKLNPAGDKVGFVRNRNIYLVDLKTMSETQLTADGEEGGIINGTFDWVYEEEFGLRDGWTWSPDGKDIAFFKLDESHTHDFFMTDLMGRYPVADHFRYPKAGAVNSEIEVGVIDIAKGLTSFLDTDTWHSGGDTHEYIARMGWTPKIDGGYKVWMMRLNRDQNNLDLLYANPENQVISTTLNEKEPTWINVESEKIKFLKDGKHFVWRSEVDGHDHLYLYNNDGTKVASITSGDWDVTDFHGVDEKTGTAYFTAAIDSPLERNLYSIKIQTNGDKGEMASLPVKIADRKGTHRINMSADLKYYIDSFTNVTTPTVVSLHGRDGKQLKTLESNEALIKTLGEYNLPVPEFINVPAADGTPLNAYVIKPKDFDPNKQYPLLMYVYGGPGSQTVQDTWGGSRYLWHAFLADSLGILVASVDNRGTGARGKAFKSVTYKKLGILEAQDQQAAAHYFGDLPYVDASRIGIWGWSYGGFMTLMSLTTGDGPETFKVGVSVAPVTDWKLYDTIYTERYMSTPQKNAVGYEETSPQTYADRLSDRQKLLLIHGDFDDNVHFQNSAQMIDKLEAANKQFQFMMYPGRNHGIFGGVTRLHLFEMATDFLRENL